MKVLSRGAVGAVVVAVISASGLMTVQPATAGKYNYYQSISCGTLSPVRTAGVSTRGVYSSDLGWSGYKFTWQDARSELFFNACGSAAPYGQYAAPSKFQKLRTEFRVSSVSLSNCKASNKVSFAKDKDGGTVGDEFTTSCDVGSKVQKRVLTTTSSNRPARLVHGGSIVMAGSYCNYAQLAVFGVVHAPRYNFDYAPVQYIKKVVTC